MAINQRAGASLQHRGGGMSTKSNALVLVPKPQQEDLTWNGLPFRSRSEVCLAEALDAHRVAYFANPRGRFSLSHARMTTMPDFLVLDGQSGRWGIIEVDGPHHQFTVHHDRQRDRVFRTHGIA